MEIGLEKRREVSSLADLEAAEERARAPVNFQKTTFSKNRVRSPETCYAHTVAGCDGTKVEAGQRDHLGGDLQHDRPAQALTGRQRA